ncbi:MAG: hypothetical protein L0154_01355 [Chloroflexi bacterium]|nr:hypothetical protein [Chloroflexota bacterium]
MRHSSHILLLVVVVVVLVVGILTLTIRTLPDPPIAPTPTFPEAIDYPNGRPVIH